MGNSTAREQLVQHLAFLNRGGTNQNRLAFFVSLLDFISSRLKLCGFGFVYSVIKIGSTGRFVCRDNNNLKVINFVEFFGFGLGGSGHSSQLFIHSEIVLIRNFRHCHRFLLHCNAFFCLYRLVKTLRISVVGQNSAGELIHNNNFSVFDNIIPVFFVESVSN